MNTQITITPFERRTCICFSRLLRGDFDTIIRNKIKTIGIDADVRYVEDTDFTAEYRINMRLGKKQRILLMQQLCGEFGIDAPSYNPRKLPKNKVFKNLGRVDTGVICGFIGNLADGDYEFLYS